MPFPGSCRQCGQPVVRRIAGRDEVVIRGLHRGSCVDCATLTGAVARAFSDAASAHAARAKVQRRE